MEDRDSVIDHPRLNQILQVPNDAQRCLYAVSCLFSCRNIQLFSPFFFLDVSQVFDGHGGVSAAEYARLTLPPKLKPRGAGVNFSVFFAQ